MTVRRITSVKDVLRLWPFFAEGIKYVVDFFRYSHALTVYRKILCYLVYKNANAWVGVVFDETQGEKPISFVLAHEITPLFSDYREFEVSMFYYLPGYRHTILLLQSTFDTFCKENEIRQYYLTTPTVCAGAARAYTLSWDGLKRSNTIYKRKVT